MPGPPAKNVTNPAVLAAQRGITRTPPPAPAAPAAAAPEKRALDDPADWPGTEWIGDYGELYTWEQTIAHREAGLSLQDFQKLSETGDVPMEILAVTAVLIARRSNLDIPMATWRKLRMRDITMPEADEANPT